MNNFSKLKNYIVDSEFRITFFENKIHVVNYLDLVTLGSNQIKIQTYSFTLLLIGENLTLSKMLDHEILIHGKII